MRNGVFTLVLAVATTYCSGNDIARGADLPQPVAPGQSVALTRLASGSESLTFNSGITESTRLVVRDAATWASTWSRIWTVRPAPPLPAIDFNREMVIVVGLGTRPTGGYSIAVESASTEAGNLNVVVRTDTPDSGCLLFQALTSPVDVARIPRTDATVEFRDRNVTRSC
jgi:protease stability complex PrcB-like protein